MYERILVCLDGSELAEAILPYAIAQARSFASELVLFRTYSESSTMSVAMPGMPSVPVEGVHADEKVMEDEKETAEYLQSLETRLQEETGLAVAYGMAYGSPGPTIIDYCKDQDISLIAIATHGRSGLSRLVLGSVADYLIKHSPVPLLLTRPAGDDTR